MKTRLPLLFLLVFCGIQLVSAQQDPIYTQYLQNPLVVNPAYAGINNNLQAQASYRLQWLGLEGQPKTLNLNGAISILNNKAGVGAALLQDRIGGTTITEFNASFAYKLKLSDDLVLSFGMQGGVIGFKTDNSGLNIRDANDDAFPEGVTRATKLNLGAGAILKSEKFMIGLSVPRMLPTSINSGSQAFDLYNQHYYLFGAYAFVVNEHLNFKPSALIRAVKGAPISADVAFNLNYNQRHTAGIFTRSLNTYGILLQTLVNEKFRFGYVFELPTKKSVGPAFSTHEISVGLRMGILNFHDRSLTNF